MVAPLSAYRMAQIRPQYQPRMQSPLAQPNWQKGAGAALQGFGNALLQASLQPGGAGGFAQALGAGLGGAGQGLTDLKTKEEEERQRQREQEMEDLRLAITQGQLGLGQAGHELSQKKFAQEVAESEAERQLAQQTLEQQQASAQAILARYPQLEGLPTDKIIQAGKELAVAESKGPSEVDKALSILVAGQKKEPEFGEFEKQYYTDVVFPEFTASRERQTLLNEQVSAYKQMESALDQGATTGPGSEIIQDLRSFVGTYMPDLMSPEQLATMEATDLFQAQARYLIPRVRPEGAGQTSDFEFESYMRSIPNMMRSPQGNRALIKTSVALMERKQEEERFRQNYILDNKTVRGLEQAMREELGEVNFGLPRSAEDAEAGEFYIEGTGQDARFVQKPLEVTMEGTETSGDWTRASAREVLTDPNADPADVAAVNEWLAEQERLRGIGGNTQPRGRFPR